MMTVKELKKGEFFTKRPIECPNENQVWVRGEYDRTEKGYCCHRWSDVNDYQIIKGTKPAFVDFCF